MIFHIYIEKRLKLLYNIHITHNVSIKTANRVADDLNSTTGYSNNSK